MDSRVGSSDLKLFASLAQLLSQQSGRSGGKVTYCSATCLDQQCQHKLFFPQHEASVECPNCGQRHSVVDLLDYKVLGSDDQRFAVEVTQLRKMYSGNKKTAEQVKVRGISNLQCKLLSPLLSTYGMGKNDQPCTLEELNVGKIFDCSKLCNRSFTIDESHLQVLGYGLDRSGSQLYLQDTLQQLKSANAGEDRLVPVHADGDGHCLVHAISRCLVGRELFWHALRSNLHAHLTSNLQRYQNLFKEFYSTEDWDGIVAEAGPDWKPPDGQTMGLCNIHVYGLANVLHRPIILLDSLMGLQSSGDYSAIFLPTMLTPQECSSKDGAGELKLNSPVVIAWSNSGRNHFIPLVPVKGKPLPRLPPHLQPKVWGSEESELKRYVRIETDGSMLLCGGKELGERYLLRLIHCMEKLFLSKNKVVPSLVSDVDQYVFKVAGCVGMGAADVIASTRAAVEEGRLFRCLICSALSMVPPDWLTKGGMLYQKAAESSVKLVDGLKLTFPFDGISASYSSASDSLTPLEVSCFRCTSVTRRCSGEGGIVYENGDRTETVSAGSRCGCGYMHYWDGEEFDNLPERVPLSLSWGGKTKSIDVYWFQYESDPARNSNVYQVASKAVCDHFPGEFGSERLVQQVVDHILRVTENKEGMEQVSGHHPSEQTSPQAPDQASSDQSPKQALGQPFDIASKIILTGHDPGHKLHTVHKEELTMSNSERAIKKRVEENARIMQNKRKSSNTTSPQTTPTSKSPPSSKTTPTSKSPPSPVPKPTAGSTPTASGTTASGSIPKIPSSKVSEKRIRVTSSDGRTCNMKLDLAVTYAQLQEAIERELGIPRQRQKLRSGFPPRELLPPVDPTQPVELHNGEKVSVDILPLAPAETEVRGLEDRGEVSPDSKSTEIQQRTQQAFNALLQKMLGTKEIDLWSVAQHQPQLFRKGGDYYKQVMDRYGTQLSDGTHIQFQELPNKTFAYNASAECLELCLGVQHMPVGPLTPQLEQLAILASTPDKPPEPGDPSVGGHGGRAAHVQAFSGRGHTLSSGSNVAARGGATDPVMHTAKLVAERRLVDLRGQETLLKQQVRALNKRMADAEVNEDAASAQGSSDFSSLETQLINTSSELKKIRDEISELAAL